VVNVENKPVKVAVGWVGLEELGGARSTIYPGLGESSFSTGVDEGIGPCQRQAVVSGETMKKKHGSLLGCQAHINITPSS